MEVQKEQYENTINSIQFFLNQFIRLRADLCNVQMNQNGHFDFLITGCAELCISIPWCKGLVANPGVCA